MLIVTLIQGHQCPWLNVDPRGVWHTPGTEPFQGLVQKPELAALR